MKIALRLVFLLLVVGLAAPALAGWQTHAGIGLQIWVPEDWKQKAEEDTLTVTSPDDAVAVVYLGLEIKDLQAARAALDPEIGKLVKNPKVSAKPREVAIHAIRGIVADGSGNIEGAPADWTAAIFIHGGKGLLMLGYGEASKLKKHQRNVDKMLSGIKKP